MARTAIGLCLNALNLPLRPALARALELGVSGAEFLTVGDFTPRSLSQTGRRELRHLFRSHDLELAALVCPLRRGLEAAEHQQQRIESIQEVMTLSFDLGPRLVVIEVGKIPNKDDDAGPARMRDALLSLGRHGDRIGATLALQTGLESGEALSIYLDGFDTGSLGVCLNPGNLLAGGHDPIASARALGRKIAYVHATDARRSAASRDGRAVALGHGDIDWLGLLGTLEEVGYRGWITVPAEAGADAVSGVQFLQRLTGQPPLPR